MEGESEITAYNIHSSARRVLANLDEYAEHLRHFNSIFHFDSSTNSIWCLAENPEGKVDY
jgi:hypothetical protein